MSESKRANTRKNHSITQSVKTEPPEVKRSRIKTPTPPQISNPLTDKLVQELHKVFKELSFEVDRNKLDDFSMKYDHIHGLTCEKKDICECFALKVYYSPDSHVLVDRIRYKYAAECKLTGTDILRRLTNTFLTHNIQPVQLYDIAKIHVTINNTPAQINLAIYSILLHGISWYNKYGYLSDTHDREVENNREVANSPITPKLRKDINNVFGDTYNVEPNTTFRAFTESVNEVRLDGSIPDERKEQFIRAYLLMEAYLIKNKKIKYSYYDLKLRF
jgi:hypothetical protein